MDLIYDNDEGFWSTVKTFSDEAKVPIVLTCTEYERVRIEMDKFMIENSRVEHLMRSDLQQVSKYLRVHFEKFRT